MILLKMKDDLKQIYKGVPTMKMKILILSLAIILYSASVTSIAYADNNYIKLYNLDEVRNYFRDCITERKTNCEFEFADYNTSYNADENEYYNSELYDICNNSFSKNEYQKYTFNFLKIFNNIENPSLITIQINYTLSPEENEEVEDAASRIASRYTGMDQYNQLLNSYTDYIKSVSLNVLTDSPQSYSKTPYNALVKEECSSSISFVLGYKMILNKLHIENQLISGRQKSNPDQDCLWLIVKIVDFDYHIDPYMESLLNHKFDYNTNQITTTASFNAFMSTDTERERVAIWDHLRYPTCVAKCNRPPQITINSSSNREFEISDADGDDVKLVKEFLSPKSMSIRAIDAHGRLSEAILIPFSFNDLFNGFLKSKIIIKAYKTNKISFKEASTLLNKCLIDSSYESQLISNKFNK